MVELDSNPEDSGARGSTLYESLRNTLEPALDGQFIAIHVDSGEYATARSTAAAMRAIRRSHSNGPLYLRKIGNEPEYGLIARMLEGELRAAGTHK